LESKSCKLLIVADGHGPTGNHVSECIIQILPKILEAELLTVI